MLPPGKSIEEDELKRLLKAAVKAPRPKGS